MKHTGLALQLSLVTLALASLISVERAQSQPVTPQYQDSDLTRQQLAGFDQFLDKHPELAERLRKDPSLVKNEEFVENHPDLQRYMQDHPELREEFKENSSAFMRAEHRFDQREDARDRDMTRGELANMDRFLDSHPEIAEQLHKNPSLVNNNEFVEGHPALQQFLAQNPELRDEFKENPSALMHAEQRSDRPDDRRDRDLTRAELGNMDRFMDNHPEITEQLRKNPSLVNNKEFVENHPALQQFLADHPELREEYKENPNSFMRQEQKFDRREDSSVRGDRDVTRGELSNFHEFLEGHNNIAGELSKNPSLATNEEYLENHPALRDYLKANPKVHEELSENPQSFVASTQQFGRLSGRSKTAAVEPKSK